MYENFSRELIVENQYNEVYTIVVNANIDELPSNLRIPEGKWSDIELDQDGFEWSNYPEKEHIINKIFSTVTFK